MSNDTRKLVYNIQFIKTFGLLYWLTLQLNHESWLLWASKIVKSFFAFVVFY